MPRSPDSSNPVAGKPTLNERPRECQDAPSFGTCHPRSWSISMRVSPCLHPRGWLALGVGTSRLGKHRFCAFGLRPRRSRMAQQGAAMANTAGDDGHFALPHLLHLHGANPCSALPLPRPSQVAGLQPCDCGDIPGSWRVRVRGSIIWGGTSLPCHAGSSSRGSILCGTVLFLACVGWVGSWGLGKSSNWHHPGIMDRLCSLY